MKYLVMNYKEDWRSVLFIWIALGLTAIQWTETLNHPALYATSLLFAFLGCVIDHNHQHHPTFKYRGLNQIFGVMITWVIGQPAAAVIPMHVMNHHVHNNHEEDFVRTSLVGFRWNFLNLVLFPFIAIRGYARAKHHNFKDWSRRQPKLYRQLILERWALYPLVLTLLITSPAATLLYVMVPWLFGQWGIIAINLVQHDGCDPESKYNHTRNFTGGWPNWWTFNNGFHSAHHLQPHLHWTRLPQIHAELEPRLEPTLQERSLLAATFRLYVWPGVRPLKKGLS